jgi:hypothetical protein
MPFLELFDETLDINSTENYEMSVQVSPDGLAFCLLDTIRNKFVLLRSFEPDDSKYFNLDRVRDLLIKDDFLIRHYKRVKLVMPSMKFTLIPASLFDPSKKDEYFTFNHILNEGNTILSNRLTDPDAYLIYSVQQPLSDLLGSYYPNIIPLHHVKPLLHQISLNRKNINGYYIHLHAEREYFNLIVFESNTLKLCNAYKYKNITDILYFTMNVFHTMRIGQEETIHISGAVENYEELSANLSLYVRNVKYSVPAGNFTFSYVFTDTAQHRYINLFSAINCE